MLFKKKHLKNVVCNVADILFLPQYNMTMWAHVSATHPPGAGSPVVCNVMVSSPNLLKAAPAAVNISPTWKIHYLLRMFVDKRNGNQRMTKTYTYFAMIIVQYILHLIRSVSVLKHKFCAV